LKVISENLIGERIENALDCLDVCPKNNDCTRELERAISNILVEMVEGIK
jgi:hypothetical protein